MIKPINMDILLTDVFKLKRPNSFHVMLKPAGPLCNLNCCYCYYLEKKKLYPGKEDFRMSYVLLEEFIKQYIETHQVLVVTFTWQGGEPTLMGLDFYKRALELQKRYANGKTLRILCHSDQALGSSMNTFLKYY
jgi:uncharacterized protein